VLRGVGTTATMGVLLAAVVALPASPSALHAAQPVSASQDSTPLTTERAQIQALATGKDVQATAATTETSTLTAHPNGTFTVSQSLIPVRKRVTGGGWADLDPTLRKNADGSISAAVTTTAVTLSGGGKAPLATMLQEGQSLAVSLPMDLPAPTLSGATATYANVLDGVDLKVTVDERGSFSEVLVVKDAKAAANPALKKLTLATRTSPGLKLNADASGRIAATDSAGRAVFAALSPKMWDSKAAGTSGTAPGTVKDRVTGRVLNPHMGEPVNSSVSGPGDGARTAPIATRVDPDGSISLTPDNGLLTSATTDFPLFMDPTFYAPSAGGSLQHWAQTNSSHPDQHMYDVNDSDSKTTIGGLRIGYNGWDSPFFKAQSYVEVSVDSRIYDATVLSSEINFTEVWNAGCSTAVPGLYLVPVNSGVPRNTLSTSTTWNNAPDLGTSMGAPIRQNCDPQGLGYDIRSAMATAASQHVSSLTFGLKAADDSDMYQWKKLAYSVNMSTTYNHAPNKSSSLHTSPATSCADVSYAGDGDVWLYAGVSDQDGGTLGAKFHAVKHGTSTPIIPDSDPNHLTGQSGDTLAFKLSKDKLEAAANGQIIDVDWSVTTTDFNATSPSATCTFKFDASRPGAPKVELPAGDNYLGAIGTAVGLSISPKCSPTCAPGETPSGYQYQINGGAPLAVTADSSGNASVQVTPSRRTNLISVISTSPSGNFGQSFSGYFNSKAPAPAAAGDLSGDGQSDLLTVGGKFGLPSGLWLARNQGDAPAGVTAAANNIGAYGTGPDGANSPTSFDGSRPIVGRFTDSNLQDVLVYYPGTNKDGSLLRGSGDGSPIQAQLDGNQNTVKFDALNRLLAHAPIQLAAAGTAARGTGGLTDLIGISQDVTSTGYKLFLVQGSETPGRFIRPLITNVSPPTGTWDQWTLVTCQLPSATGPKTAMYLWNKSSGRLDLWENLDYDATTGALAHDAYQIAADWNTGIDLDIQAADIDANGAPDLWAIGTSGSVVSYRLTDLPSRGIHIATSSGTLLTASHSWALKDGTSGSAATAVDAAAALPLTGTGVTVTNADGTKKYGGPSWHGGDMFDPDLQLDGNGEVTASAKAITPDADFTVSAWAKPDGLGNILLSQDGSLASSFALWADSDTKTWRFQMPRTDTATPTQDVVTSGNTPAQVGVWVHLTATYQHLSGKQSLYVNGVPVGTGTHASSSWATNGKFRVGSYLYNGVRGRNYVGQISQVQTWDQALSDSQVAALVDMPPSPSELQLTTLTDSGTLNHTSRNINGNFTAWDAVRDMAYIPGTFRSATQAEYQGTTYLAALGNAVEFQVRPFGSSTWGSPTGTDAPLPDRVGSTSVTIASVNASAIVNGDFDLIATGSDGHLYEALRHPNGTWVSWTDLTAQIAGSIGTIQEVAAATTTGGDLHLVLIAGNKLMHATRSSARGTWTGWGDVYAVSSNPGTPGHVAAAGVAGVLQVMVVTNNGSGIYHTIRAAKGTWGGFGDVKAATASNPGTVVSIAMAGVDTGAANHMQFVAVNSTGTIYHSVRKTTGAWTTMGNVTTYVQGTLYGTPKSVIAAGD